MHEHVRDLILLGCGFGFFVCVIVILIAICRNRDLRRRLWSCWTARKARLWSWWSARKQRANRPAMAVISQTRRDATSARQPSAAAQSSAAADSHGAELHEVTADVHSGSGGQHAAPLQPASTSEEEEAALQTALAASLAEFQSVSREAEDLELAQVCALSIASDKPAVATPADVHEATAPPLAPQPPATHPPTAPRTLDVAIPPPHSQPPPALSMQASPPSRGVCTTCGFPIGSGSRFCGGCGTRIEAADQPRSAERAGGSMAPVEAVASPSMAEAVPSPRLHADVASHAQEDAQEVERGQEASASGRQPSKKATRKAGLIARRRLDGHVAGPDAGAPGSATAEDQTQTVQQL